MVKSYEANPNPDELYSKQVSSVNELKKRARDFTKHVKQDNAAVETGFGALDKAKMRLNTVVKDIDGLHESFGSEMSANLIQCKERNKVIQKQLLRTFIKFERLLHLESKAAASGLAGNNQSTAIIDSQMRDKLLAA